MLQQISDSTQLQFAVGLGIGLAGVAFMQWSNRSPSGPLSPETAPKLRGFTREEIKAFDGTNGGPVYMSVKRRVYSVAPHFYGVDGPYACFAAKDSSRNLGKSLVSDTEADADWTTLSEAHIDVLNDWDEKFRMKYETVGWYVPDELYYQRGATFTP